MAKGKASAPWPSMKGAIRSSAMLAPPPVFSTETRAEGSIPASADCAAASARSDMKPTETKLCNSFSWWPAPTAPTCGVSSVKASSTGRMRAMTSASPPNSRFSLPSWANFAVRVMGASTKNPPAACTAAAIRRVDPGSAVEQSTTTALLGSAISTPSGPVRIASTWGEPVTQRMITSDPSATAAGVATEVAPSASNSSTGWLPGWSRKVNSCPPRKITLRAMPWPIRPTPMIPVFIFVPHRLCFWAHPPASHAGRCRPWCAAG